MTRALLGRVVLVAVFVALAYQLDWDWLRFLTSEAVLRVCGLLGLAETRVASDAILFQRTRFQFVTACTFIDVWAGSIPLLWNVDQSALKNALGMMRWTVGLFGFNVIRLVVSQELYAHGTPWSVTEGIVGGLAYFLVWCVIWRRRAWGELRSRSGGVHPLRCKSLTRNLIMPLLIAVLWRN